MASVEDLPYHHSYICVKTEMKVHETIRPSMSARPRSSMRFLKLWWQIALEWLHDVASALCWGEAGARNLVFFRVKWLQPAMKGTSSVRRLRLRSFHARIVPPIYVFCNEWLFLCA